MIRYNLEYELRANSILYLKYTINGNRKYKSTGWKIPVKQWDHKNQIVRESNLKHTEINNDLSARKQAFISSLLKAQLKGQSSVVAPVLHATFYSFVESWLSELKHKRKPGTINNNIKLLERLKKFAGDELTIEQVDADFLRAYEDNLKNKKSTYPFTVMAILRSWLNAALKKGIIDKSPFANYEMPTGDAKEKDYLTLDELNKWEKYLIKSEGIQRQAAAYFLLGCYSGLRMSDWYNFSPKNIHQKEIRIRAQKNGNWVSIPIHKRLGKVVEVIKETPLTIARITLDRQIRSIAKELEINKRVTTHSGRKTFAVTMCAEQGISSETCAEILGITIAVCVESYYRVTSDKIKNETSRAWAGL